MSSVLDSFKKLLRISEDESKLTDAESKRLGRYQVLEEVNHKVYRGIDKVTGQEVAIKKTDKTNLKTKQKENLLREAAIHKRLHHPNIVQFIDFFETSQNYFLIMELMRGGELFERIEAVDCFTEDDAIHIILQVARGIKYLHDNGIVHRDIKPENLVFGNKTLTPLKICDFGLSKVLDGSGMTDTPCGTVGYLAPEIAKEQAHNFGVDIWGLGCVLYSLLCGFPVFYDQSVPVLTDKVKRGIYDFPSPWWDDVSESVLSIPSAQPALTAKDLIKRCLIVDPSRRITITQFLNHPWINRTGLARHDADLQNKASRLALKSPAIMREVDNKVVRMKEVFDVSYAAQRDMVDGFQPVLSKNAFALGGVGGSTLLGKRQNNPKAGDAVAVASAAVPAASTVSIKAADGKGHASEVATVS